MNIFEMGSIGGKKTAALKMIRCSGSVISMHGLVAPFDCPLLLAARAVHREDLLRLLVGGEDHGNVRLRVEMRKMSDFGPASRRPLGLSEQAV